MGPEVEAFENQLCSFVGTGNAVSCASGTDALVIALMAKGVGPGDAVFTTPFTFVATAEAIALVGARPVFVDVDPVTFNLDAGQLDRAVCAAAAEDAVKPRGIIGVDLFGLPADYEAINGIAASRGLFVIEDAAQSFGARSGNRVAGALAEIGCTSFFPAKPLGCCGDGGALFTDDDELADRFRSIRVHGQGMDRYENVRLGLTGRLDALQAAILAVKLKVFPEELAERQRVANTYAREIRNTDLALETPHVPEGRLSSWAQYSLLATDAEARQGHRDKLQRDGIPTAVYYPIPLHLQSAFAYLRYKQGDFPVSENLAERIFSVPMHPYLADDQIAAIVTAML